MKDIFLCRALGWNVARQISYLKAPLIKTINMEIFVIIKNIPLFNHLKGKVIQNVIYFSIWIPYKRTEKHFFLAGNKNIIKIIFERMLIHAHILAHSELLHLYFNKKR